ncbi:MAG: hypothetical protein NT074_02490 [Methanomicrobiales archaeon]|nr:hypothetical protein [Methanomicrobiales archaeon]
MKNKSRPLGVTIIGILYILGGLITLSRSIVGSAIMDFVGLGPISTIFGIAATILGIISLVLGVGCFMGWGWVWTFAVIVSILNIIMSIGGWAISGFSGIVEPPLVIGVIIPAIILWYLFQENVKRYFGK